MIAIELSSIANHLWQSTLFAAAAIGLAGALKKNGARTRYWLWLAASVKFLIPFSLMVSIGSRVQWRSAPVLAPHVSVAIEQIGQPFAAPAVWGMTPKAPFPIVPVLLLFVWQCGCAVTLTIWLIRWIRLRAVVKTACRLDAGREVDLLSRLQEITGVRRRIAVVSVDHAGLEPGVIGVWSPVLLLPAGIADRLADPQLEAILAHELCHVGRRDNLTAALHMVVEAAFWFHPLVWWIGARLIEAREHACDEEVVRLTGRPQVYAEGILNVCKFYVQSRLPCAPGVTGSDLKKRIEAIMSNRISRRLTPVKKLLLASATALAVAGPMTIGILHAPRILARPQDSGPAFEVASVKPNKSGARRISVQRGQGYLGTNVTLHQLITFAYDMRPNTINGAPGWMGTERFDVAAKAPPDATDEQRRRMMQSLLAERFKLVVHRDQKEMPVYALLVAKNGPKLKASQAEDSEFKGGRGLFLCQKIPMEMLARELQRTLGQSVVDQTGLTGAYDFKLEWEPDEAPAAPGPGEKPAAAPDQSGASLATALQEQLGLRLESRKAPVEFLIIDHVERVPTGN